MASDISSFRNWIDSIRGPLVRVLTWVTAAVWLLFGLGFKVLGLVPRHRQIVAGVLGESLAGPATVFIGVGETLIGLWIATTLYPRLCAAVQTVAIVAMNILELRFAKNLLLSPILMVFANTVLLLAGWYRALKLNEMRS